MIEASAPVRICDIGGWTDTWFGGPGRILNIAVTPGVDVSIRATRDPGPVVLDVDAFGDRYSLFPRTARVVRHPLLEAAIDAFPPSGDTAVEIRVRSDVPAGCGTGTSAAVAVALLGALADLRSDDLSPRQIAYEAHRLEVDSLGRQSGIQDQLSAALGGMNYIEIDSYPEASVSALPSWEELGSRLTLLFLGQAHESSAVHRQVIEDVRRRGEDTLSRLREAAVAACDAVRLRDLGAFGAAMVANTEAQAALHPDVVGVDARRAMECAAAQGALGWKVNGAGGDGGSVSILSPSPEAKTALEQHVLALDARFRVLPIALDTNGLEVRGSL